MRMAFLKAVFPHLCASMLRRMRRFVFHKVIQHMRYSQLLVLFFLFSINATFAQQRPKLIVGIVVDQMRYDYLYRYQQHYGQGGFNRLLKGGFSCENTHFNYMPTYTGPGHAAIYTGTTPALNGIIGNNWWARDSKGGARTYCTTDKTRRPVGGTKETALRTGQHSPAWLLSSTITDELRLSNNFRSKVAAVCLKDRGSILPAGHIPNGCYWFDDASGNWITSTYYPDSLGLPKWVRDYNAERWPDTFLNKEWDAGHVLTEVFPNWNYIGNYGTIKKIGFTHKPWEEKGNQNYNVLRYTTFGNTMVTDFAMRAIEGMELGADEWPDFLSVSYSATDYCAHQFGIHAEEIEDMYVRMDKDITRLFDYLERKFGKDNVLVFLTADHGGAETPEHMKTLRIPAGVFPESKLKDTLNQLLAKSLGGKRDYVSWVENQQIWLNWPLLDSLKLKTEDIAPKIRKYLMRQPGMYDVLTRAELSLLPADYPFVSEIRRGIHPTRSGDIVFILDPAWHADDGAFEKGGTTHGSQYAYDTHVPLLWYGWRIKPGESHNLVSITDIAPTLAAMLRIMRPNASTGKVIEELMR